MIHSSNHAVNRYWQRVKPNLPRNHVRNELKALARMGTITDAPPSWWKTDIREGHRYVEVSDGIAFALKRTGDDYIATTCVIRAGHKALVPKSVGRKDSDTYEVRRRFRRRKREVIEGDAA